MELSQGVSVQYSLNPKMPKIPLCLQVLTDMAKSIGGKPWYKINTGYYQTVNGAQAPVKPGATYKGYAAVPNNGLCWQARRCLLPGFRA